VVVEEQGPFVVIKKIVEVHGAPVDGHTWDLPRVFSEACFDPTGAWKVEGVLDA
jgi:hypothetical protein